MKAEHPPASPGRGVMQVKHRTVRPLYEIEVCNRFSGSNPSPNRPSGSRDRRLIRKPRSMAIAAAGTSLLSTKGLADAKPLHKAPHAFLLLRNLKPVSIPAPVATNPRDRVSDPRRQAYRCEGECQLFAEAARSEGWAIAHPEHPQPGRPCP